MNIYVYLLICYQLEKDGNRLKGVNQCDQHGPIHTIRLEFDVLFVVVHLQSDSPIIGHPLWLTGQARWHA
jgi:hypothetical protein